MAIGGFGGALLAGLSGLAQGLDNAQKQRERQQLTQMRQRQLLDAQRSDEASKALFGSLLGGMGDIGPTALTSPMMTGGQPPMPGQGSGSRYSPTPTGSGMSSGLSDPLSVISKYENASGDPLRGWGETDLSGYPLTDTGFPDWPGKPGPAGNSTAAGLYQITRSTWDPIARQLGITDFSPQSQRRVAEELYRTRGMSPWAPYNPRLAAALGRGEGRGSSRPEISRAPEGDTITVPPPSSVGFDPGSPEEAYTLRKMRPEDRSIEARRGVLDRSNAYADALAGGFKGTRQDFEASGGATALQPGTDAGGGDAPAPAGPSDQGGGMRSSLAAPSGQGAAGDLGRGDLTLPPLQAAIRSAPPPVQQEVQRTAVQTAASVPQPVWGRMSLSALAQQIDKANPGADPVVKMMALEKAQKLLAPTEQRLWEQYKIEHGDAIHAADQRFQRETMLLQEQIAGRRMDRTEAHQELMQQRGFEHADATGGQLVRGIGPDGNEVMGRIDKNNRFVPVDMGGVTSVQPLTGTGSGTKASTNIRITDANGVQVFSGAAHQVPGAGGESAWIDDKTNQRIQVPPGGDITITGKGDPGKQAAGQMLRLTVAANEARRQIGNVARASLGATTSWFQGVQSMQGKSLTEGLTRSLSNQLTPRDEQMMSVLGLGLSRSLASLETAGAATGMVGLTKTMEGLIPQKGDDVATALMKIAEMRQIAEQAIESASVSPAVSQAPEMRKLLTQVKDDIVKAVPYSVVDVMDLVQKPGDDTYGTFAGKIGLGGAPPKAAGSGGSPSQTYVRKNPDGTTTEIHWDGSKWVDQAGNEVK